jgi:hypothetical protein
MKGDQKRSKSMFQKGVVPPCFSKYKANLSKNHTSGDTDAQSLSVKQQATRDCL